MTTSSAPRRMWTHWELVATLAHRARRRVWEPDSLCTRFGVN
ncbi:MAG: hypothetical protein ABR608_07565 [Pseudonocardiaceae bacterium]